MNKNLKLIALAMVAGSIATTGLAQLTIPNADGSDGALNITNSIVIDLSQAVSGSWTNTSASPGNGTYDSTQWAVVFKYSSVNIASNATVNFINHYSQAPVVWLVNGAVTINGNLSLDGQSTNGVSAITLPAGGPGGFRGGGGAVGDLKIGSGFGPGGSYGGSGYYAAVDAYGNPQIFPLIGGSGGGGVNATSSGAGGGAILIAASTTITISGSCHANGGGNSVDNFGSGGGIRLIANQILGNGLVQAMTYLPGLPNNDGRIRLEANAASTGLTVYPATVPVSPSPVLIFPNYSTAPSVQIISIASLPAPIDPRAQMSTAGDDLTLATTNVSAIVVQTQNFPTSGTVNVYVRPRNANYSVLPATFVSGTTNLAIWQLNTTLPTGHAIIQVRAVY